MANTIQLKRSSTTGAVPTPEQLVQGELAVNLPDKKLYTKDNTDTVVELIPAVLKTSNTGSAVVPAGTQAQRDGSPAAGYFRFNTEVAKFEGYNGSSWGSVGGGATGGGADAVFVENDQAVTANYTIPATKNAMSTGPIAINDGITVTVSDGARWVII
jgi:hypothetical protein